MGNILNITNGDCAVEIMKKANISGVFLPWRDVLHDGPIPSDLSMEELSKVRAQFIIGRNWGAAEEITESFIQRDNELKSFREYEKVILWFEHDLYDQLQIIQILDWLESIKKWGVCKKNQAANFSVDSGSSTLFSIFNFNPGYQRSK